MPVKPGETISIDFPTSHPTTSAAADADSTPTGTLVINSTDNGATVTVTNKETGVYKAVVTLPSSGLTDGDEVQIRVAATVAGVAAKGYVFTSYVDSKYIGDLNDASAAPTAAANADAVWDEARSGHTSSGTFGEYVNSYPTAAAITAIAAAVWGYAKSTVAALATTTIGRYLYDKAALITASGYTIGVTVTTNNEIRHMFRNSGHTNTPIDIPVDGTSIDLSGSGVTLELRLEVQANATKPSGYDTNICISHSSIVSGGTADQKVRFTPTATQMQNAATNASTFDDYPNRQSLYAYSWQLVRTDTSDDEVIKSGVASVIDEIASCA